MLNLGAANSQLRTCSCYNLCIYRFQDILILTYVSYLLYILLSYRLFEYQFCTILAAFSKFLLSICGKIQLIAKVPVEVWPNLVMILVVVLVTVFFL